MSLRFRPATEADWPQLWPILQEIVLARETYVYDPAMDSEAGMRTWLPGPPEETWLVSDEHGTVLGSYKTGPEPARPRRARGHRLLHRRPVRSRPGGRPGDGAAQP